MQRCFPAACTMIVRIQFKEVFGSSRQTKIRGKHLQSCFPRGILQVERHCRRTVASLTCRLLRQDLEVRDGVIFLSKKLPTLVAVIKRNYESNDGTKYQDEAEQLLISNIHAHHLPSGRGKQPSAVGGSAPAQKRQKYCSIRTKKMQL